MLPKKIIAGSSVRDYAYQWINGGCLIHQWCSGGRGIDAEVIEFAEKELSKITLACQSDEVRKATGWTKSDRANFAKLVAYLKANKGAATEKYIPDRWTE